MSRMRVPVPLRWADMDAYGHVNNVAVLRLLEEARIAAFWRHPEAADPGASPAAVLDAGPGAQTHTLVARQEIEYLLPLSYRRDPVVVEMWLGHLGGASIDVCYQLTATRDGRAATDGPATADGWATAGGRATDDDDGRVVFVQATTTLVLIDAASARPRRITPDERAVWEPYLEAPLTMRRRPGS